MHKQDHTTTDKGLDTIIESMYTAAAMEPLSEKHPTAKCDHCGGTGKHGDQDCKKCGGDGWIDAKDVVKEAPLAHDISRKVGMEPALQDANPYIGMVLKKIFDEFNALQGQDLPPSGPRSKPGLMFAILHKWMDEPASRLAGTRESTVKEAPGDALDDEQYGQPSLGDLALSDDQSELTATLIDADGASHSIAINLLDPVKVKLRPGQGPGAGESIIQLAFHSEPEETDRIPPQDAPSASFPYPGARRPLGSDRSEDKWTT